jgi:hypothetical protein
MSSSESESRYSLVICAMIYPPSAYILEDIPKIAVRFSGYWHILPTFIRRIAFFFAIREIVNGI